MKIKASAFAAAAFPETITASKEFTPTCTKIFAIAKMPFWIPAGMPSIRIARAASLWILSFERKIRQPSVRFRRWRTIRKAEIYWAITLARATPSAAIWQPITKKRFRSTFNTPATERYKRGLFVSPAALKIPFPQL